MLDAMLQDIVEILYTSLKQPSYEDMVSLNSSEKQLNGTLDTTVPKSESLCVADDKNRILTRVIMSLAKSRDKSAEMKQLRPLNATPASY